QWMFNRTALQNDRAYGPRPVGRYYQIVISASRALAGRSQEDIISQVVGELAGVWPEAGEAKLLHGRLVTEHKAVFSPTPDAERRRLPQRTAIPSLHLAGDWTRTGWPATMEGAVRSGYLAAENVLADLGTPQRLIQPDLRPALLSRLFLGVS
ncbi:MAG: FAD-dependent oxidoreductase, partial [Planctomycetaceae bacterium]